LTKVKFAIPKGHLGDQISKILERAGYRITGHDRTYRPGINDPEIELKVLRPQEIPTYVSEGVQDVGISGRDWVAENKADVETLLDLEYAKVRLVIADEGSTLRISTEYLNAAKEYIKQDPAYKEEYGDKEPVVITAWWRIGENERVTVAPRKLGMRFIEGLREATK